jgi:dienelactone hydrolase
MKMRSQILTFAAVLATAVTSAHAQPAPGADAPDSRGTGPFPAIKEIDPGLPEQVVYRPADLGALGQTKLGIYAFGNGACSDDAASARQHLLQIASYGYVAIAPGRVYSGPGRTEREPGPPPNPTSDSPTRPQQLIEAIDWVLAENERAGSRYYQRIDPNAIAVSGFSCGGMQALVDAHDPRIGTVVIMNSGLFPGETSMGGMTATKELLNELHTPVIYILGGSAGSLARRNSIRNPGRTAATAAARMFGVALVAFVATRANGL